MLSNTSPDEQDAKFRATIVGQSQVEIEQALIKAQNGVFILCTPTIGTPQLIGNANNVPEGLIPAARLQSYDTSVKPRVITTHEMPRQGINSLFLHEKQHRARIDSLNEMVDETHFSQLLAKYPKRFFHETIGKERYENEKAQDMPAAFYYWLPAGQKVPQYAAVFAKQINASENNSLSSQGIYHNRIQDLTVVNRALKNLHLPAVEQLLQIKDLRRSQYIAFDNAFNELADKQQWNHIVQSGEKLLQSAKLNAEEKAKIHCRLTSTNFYLGHYAKCDTHSQQAVEQSKLAKNYPLQVRSLYLRSASHRANQRFETAISSALEAEQCYESNNIDDPQLYGKLYYNLAAAHDDNPSGNHKLSFKCFLIAAKHYRSCGANNDLNRTQIRLIINASKYRTIHEANCYADVALKRLDTMKPRTKLHCYLAVAALRALENKLDDSKVLASQAKKLATDLGAANDLRRAESLLGTSQPAITAAYKRKTIVERLGEVEQRPNRTTRNGKRY